MKTDTTVDPTIRLRLAARIHFALRRHYGEDVEVSALLRGLPEAREALWVCVASGDAELTTLAKQFTKATESVGLGASKSANAPAAAPQETAWSQDTSGFGLTRPPALDDSATLPAPKGWRQRMKGLRSPF